ncbi:MAG TPA: small acid-soluble spore protein SspI [Mollicutes bacterium]|jgi:small acid-soluble spore protein I (minor)|nr:small acid-soluble spore protein SspI [Mollicutes bacterium]
MEIDIREYIKNNFKDSTSEEIRESIEEAIKKEENLTLPGLGVLFELLWENNNESNRKDIIDVLINSFKQGN